MNELNLSNSEEKYKIIFENSPNIIVLMNIKGELLDCNRQCEIVTGFNKNEIIGKNLYDLAIFPPEYFTLSKKNFERLLEGQKIEPHELKMYKKDGSSIWIYLLPSLLKLNEQNLIQIVAQDITTLKKIDINFKELLESERRYKNILENTKDAIAIVGLDGKFTYISPQLSKIVGRNIESNQDLFKNLHPLDIPPLRDMLFDAIKKKDATFVEAIEFRILHNVGYYIWLSSVSKNYYNESGEMIGFIVSLRNITERKEAEQKLKESEEKFRDLAELLPEHVFEVDTRGKVTYSNPAGLNMFGYSEEDLKKGIFVFDLLSNQSEIEIVKKAIGLSLSGKFTEPQEYSCKKKDGTTFYVRIHSRPIFKNEKVVGLRGIISDITEKKLGELKLKESETKYRHLFNSSPYAILLLDLQGIVIDCNDTMNNFMIWFKKEDLIGKSFLEVIKMFSIKGDKRVKSIGNLLNKKFNELLKYGFFEPFEFNISRGDRKNYWLTFESSFLTLNEQKYIQLFIIDKTAMNEATLRLKESEEKYRLISENANDLIYILDKDAKYLYCNKMFYKILGFEPNELLGKSALDFIHPDDKKQNIKELEHSLNFGLGSSTARFICKDGKYKWLESIGNVTYDENREPVKIFGVSRDITLRKEIEEKLRKSEEELILLNKELEHKVKERTLELERKNIELEKLDEAKDNFLSIAAHELKTPLISIAGYTDYILTKYNDQLQVDIKNDLSIVKKNIKRLHNLINLLLDATKLDSHALKLNKEETNVSEIIYKCLHELNYLFKEKYQEMILNLDNEIILNVDPEKLFQVFSNLISNANKFTPKEGKIEISAIKQNDCYLFEVKDNGIGISENNLNRIFDKFKTIHDENGEDFHQGTGLGLFISKGFVESHGGKIWATSEGLNKGTTIHFTIPI